MSHVVFSSSRSSRLKVYYAWMAQTREGNGWIIHFLKFLIRCEIVNPIKLERRIFRFSPLSVESSMLERRIFQSVRYFPLSVELSMPKRKTFRSLRISPRLIEAIMLEIIFLKIFPPSVASSMLERNCFFSLSRSKHVPRMILVTFLGYEHKL